MPTTFISYRRDDAAGYAGRLHEALEHRLGPDQIFRDVDTLEPGQDFIDAIQARLGECRVLLAMIGREWLDARDAAGRRRLDQTDDYVRLEIASALSRRDVRVIPVLIEGASLPAPEMLPEDLRSLVRKQAVHLRDDAWDHDVDRLAAAISGATNTPIAHTPRASASPRRWLILGPALAGLAALAVFALTRGGATGPDAAVSTERSADSSRGSSSPVRGQAHGVAIPRVAEVAHTALIYTILSASVVPLANGNHEVRVRVRFSNEGRYDANAWDDSFRLVVGSETLPPTSRLNEIARAHSLTQGIVTFEIPANVAKAILRVLEGSRIGEIPLDLSVTKLPAPDERADAGDALSHATIASIPGTPRPLVRDGDLRVTIDRASSRRFVNVLRLRLTLRYDNAGRYPAGSGDAMLRIAAGDQLLPPIEEPNLVVQGNANAVAEVEFEVPSTTTRAVLRGTIRDTSGEWPLEIP